ncbi:MAG: creatininase family protein [Planctomycetota bacterium]
MTELADSLPPAADALLGPFAVVLQPLGALEPRGLRLPLAAGGTIARAVAVRAAADLAAAGVAAAVLPALPYGLSRRAERRRGWISLRPGTLWALLEDVFESLVEQGVRRIVLVNTHDEPEHAEVLDGVILDHPEIAPEQAHVLLPSLSSAALDSAEEGEANVAASAEAVVRAVRDAWPELFR